MADSSPLLTRFNSSESETQSLQKGFTSLDDTIEQCIGNSNSAQLLQAFLASLAWAFDAQQTFISVFTDREPSWHCLDSGDILCSSAGNPCRIPANAWAWDEPAHSSIISEWELTCSGPLVAGLPESAFFAGCLGGGFLLATLADSSLGRKNMLLLSCLIMSLTGILTVFSPNVWVYSFLRFITGFGRATIGTCALVLSTEIVGKRWRDKVGTIGFFCFTLGFLSLPIMGYLARGSSWRTLYLWTSIPTLCYCLAIYFFVHESPRWLFVRGRTNEAVQTLKKIASSNGKKLDDFNFSQVFIETPNVDIYLAMKILWEKKWAFRRLLAVMVVGFGVGLVYYGIPLAVGNLNFNLYLTVTFNALSELPSSIITLFFMGILNRRSLILIFTLMSGVCSILCVFMGDDEMKWLQMGSEVVAFFGACTAFDVLLIYTIELFPTCVRNSALSMVRQAVVFGGIFSPMLVVAGRKEGFLSFGVFGLVIASCGLFVIWLPETRGVAFCDTIEEQETKEIASSDYVC